MPRLRPTSLDVATRSSKSCLDRRCRRLQCSGSSISCLARQERAEVKSNPKVVQPRLGRFVNRRVNKGHDVSQTYLLSDRDHRRPRRGICCRCRVRDRPRGRGRVRRPNQCQAKQQGDKHVQRPDPSGAAPVHLRQEGPTSWGHACSPVSRRDRCLPGL